MAKGYHGRSGGFYIDVAVNCFSALDVPKILKTSLTLKISTAICCPKTLEKSSAF
jgi:hypothetical protein